MLNFKLRSLNLGVVLFTLVVATNVQSAVTVIVSAPPPPRAVVVGPPGYTRCFSVPPAFYNGVWHHQQRVCEYGANRSIKMWVNGYWQCGSYRNGGVCTRWNWIGSHWASRQDIDYYRRPAQRNYHRHYAQEEARPHAYARVEEHGRRHGHGPVYEHRHDHH